MNLINVTDTLADLIQAFFTIAAVIGSLILILALTLISGDSYKCDKDDSNDS